MVQVGACSGRNGYGGGFLLMAESKSAPHPSAVICARILRNEPEPVVHMLAENIEALVGRKVTGELIRMDGNEIAQLFGEKPVYIFPIEDFKAVPMNAFLAMDLTSAVHTGASFSLMGPEQVKEVLFQQEIPEILHDSIGEVANIICGAVANFIRMRAPSGAPEFRRGAKFRKVEPGPWPELLREYDPSIPWDLAVGRLFMEGEPIGAILLGSSNGKKGRICLGGPEAVTDAPPEVNPNYEEAPPEEVEASPTPTPEEGSAPAEGAPESKTGEAPPPHQAPPAKPAAAPAPGSKPQVAVPKPAAGIKPPVPSSRPTPSPQRPAASPPRSPVPPPQRAAGPTQRPVPPPRPGAAPPRSSPPPPQRAAPVPPAEEAAFALPPGIRVQISGQPADPAFIALKVNLETLGTQILPVYATSGPSQQAGALFVVSRSAVDLATRLDAVVRSPFRPSLVVACSDRPTSDLVMTARRSGATSFIVLPAHPQILFNLLSSLAEAAV